MKTVEFEPCGSWWALSRCKKVFRWVRYMPLGYVLAILKFPFYHKLVKDEGFSVAWIVLVYGYERKLDRYYQLKKD